MENSNLSSYSLPLLTPTESQEDERPCTSSGFDFLRILWIFVPCFVTPHQAPSFLHNNFSLPYPRRLSQIAWSVLPSCKSTRAAVLLYPFQRLFLSAQLQLLHLVVVVVKPTTPMQDQGPYYFYYLCRQRSEEGQLNDSPPALGGLQPAPPWDALQLGMGQVHPLSMPGQSLAALFRVNQAVITHFITRRVVSGPPPHGLNNAKTNALRQHCEQYSLHCQQHWVLSSHHPPDCVLRLKFNR